MKNYKRGFAPLLIIIVVVAIAGGGGYIYLQNKTPNNSDVQQGSNNAGSQVKTDEPKEEKPVAPEAYFPESIGDYKLIENNTKKVQVTDRDCRQFGQSQAQEDVKLGVTGETCSKILKAEYRQSGTDKVVFIHLQKILSGKNIAQQVVAKTNTLEKFGSSTLYRAEKHEIKWWTEDTFDLVISQEGRWKKGGADAGVIFSYSYKEKATANNPVTKYFLEKYPPAKVTVSTSSKTGVATTTKSIAKLPSTNTGSQNAADIPEAEANLLKIAAIYKERGIEEGTTLSVVAPTHSNILEPGKPVTVLFTPIKTAANYEIIITKPAWEDKRRLLISADKKDTLFKTITTSTKLDIIVPQTDTFYASENAYHGEELWVKALDASGKVLRQERVQIRILPPPNQPELAKADKYVLGKNGGTITLTLGKLPSKYSKRTISISCPNMYSIASIDGNSSCEEPITFGTGAMTKKMIVKPNFFKDRETAFYLRIQYYDLQGKEINSSGIDDESFVSIKLRRN
jgi:hypothetical protein